MKKSIILLIILTASRLLSQGPQASVWRVTPKNVCPGDSIKVDFKFNQPAGGNTNTAVYFYCAQPLVLVWQGSYMQFYSMPKETFPPMGIADSCYYMWVHIPLNYPAGTHSVISALSSQDNTFTITLPNITIPSSTLCAGNSFTFNPSGATSYTYSNGSNIVSPTTTSTYVISGTLNGCVNSKIITINVINCTTVINEYELNAPPPVYYDLQGNKTEKLYNQLIIEQSGTYRRKVYFLD